MVEQPGDGGVALLGATARPSRLLRGRPPYVEVYAPWTSPPPRVQMALSSSLFSCSGCSRPPRCSGSGCSCRYLMVGSGDGEDGVPGGDGSGGGFGPSSHGAASSGAEHDSRGGADGQPLGVDKRTLGGSASGTTEASKVTSEALWADVLQPIVFHAANEQKDLPPEVKRLRHPSGLTQRLRVG